MRIIDFFAVFCFPLAFLLHLAVGDRCDLCTRTGGILPFYVPQDKGPGRPAGTAENTQVDHRAGDPSSCGRVLGCRRA